MRIAFVHKSVPGSHKLIFQVLERVKGFAEKFGTDSDLDNLLSQVIISYGSDHPPILTLTVVDENEVVKSHLIAVLDDFFGSRTVCVLQFWKDEDLKIPAELRHEALEYLRRWGSGNGASKVRIFARNEDVAQMFEKKYGFHRDERVQMTATYDQIKELF